MIFKSLFKVISGVECLFFLVWVWGFLWGGETFIAWELDPQIYNNTMYELRMKQSFFYLSFAFSMHVFKVSLEFNSLPCHAPIIFLLYWFILKKTNLVMILELSNLQSFKCI